MLARSTTLTRSANQPVRAVMHGEVLMRHVAENEPTRQRGELQKNEIAVARDSVHRIATRCLQDAEHLPVSDALQ